MWFQIISDVADIMNESNVTRNQERNRFISNPKQIPEIAVVRSVWRLHGSAIALSIQFYQTLSIS